MVNMRLYKRARPAFFFASLRHFQLFDYNCVVKQAEDVWV